MYVNKFINIKQLTHLTGVFIDFGILLCMLTKFINIKLFTHLTVVFFQDTITGRYLNSKQG